MDKVYILMYDAGEAYENSYTDIVGVFARPPTNCELRCCMNINVTAKQMNFLRATDTGLWFRCGRESIKWWISERELVE